MFFNELFISLYEIKVRSFDINIEWIQSKIWLTWNRIYYINWDVNFDSTMRIIVINSLNEKRSEFKKNL